MVDVGVDVQSLGAGRYLVTDGTSRQIAYAVAAEERVWIFLNGRVYLIEPTPVTPPVRRIDEASALMAPMPATVMSVRVAPGDRVARGDVLITLEAMKMELPVTAPRDGIVAAVTCRPGDLVQPGRPLLEFE